MNLTGFGRSGGEKVDIGECVGVGVFIKFCMNMRSGPLTLVILCHSHWSSEWGINDTFTRL